MPPYLGGKIRPIDFSAYSCTFCMARHSALICEPGMAPFRRARTALSSASLLPLIRIVDLDHVDEGLQVGFAERDRSRGKVLTHAAAGTLKQCRVDLDGLC